MGGWTACNIVGLSVYRRDVNSVASDAVRRRARGLPNRVKEIDRAGRSLRSIDREMNGERHRIARNCGLRIAIPYASARYSISRFKARISIPPAPAGKNVTFIGYLKQI